MTLGLPRPPRGRSAKAAAATEEADAPQNGSVTGEHDIPVPEGTNGNGDRNGHSTTDPDQNGSENGHASVHSIRKSNGQFSRHAHDNGAAPEGQGFAVHDRFDNTAPPNEPDRVAALEERVERLATICEAMWDLVSEETGLELEQLTTRLAAVNPPQPLIDQPDGDDETVCPNCGNVKPAEEALCLFCSAGTR